MHILEAAEDALNTARVLFFPFPQKLLDLLSLQRVNAGVAKKPLEGKLITVTGEIIDLSCYLQLGKHGEKHRACGQKCVQNSQPVGLLTKTGMLYMLMPEEHDPRRDGGVDFRPAAADHMGHIMEVTGTEASHAGYRALYVTGYKK